jgi:threonine synthase
VGLAAARAHAPADPAIPVITAATAHPAKFPDAVERAIGRRPALPDRMGDLFERRERVTRLPNDLATVEAFVRGNARAVVSGAAA